MLWLSMYSLAFRTLLRFQFNKRLQQKILITIQRRYTGVIPQGRTRMDTCNFTDHQLLQQYWWIPLSIGICVIVCASETMSTWSRPNLKTRKTLFTSVHVRGNGKTGKSVLHLVSVRKQQNSGWNVNEISFPYDYVVVWEKAVLLLYDIIYVNDKLC